MSRAPKQRRVRYTPPGAMDHRVREFDRAVESWLGRVHAYVSGRWPRLGRWLAG